MKKIILIVVLFMSLHISAQHKNRERIKSLKVSFITEKLDLTEQEAQQFWPIYNEYEKQHYAIRYIESREIRKEIRESLDTLNDKKANALLARLEKTEVDKHNARMEFSKQLTKILSPKKIILLKIAEDDFKRKMLEEYKKRKKEDH
ncbi:hypothetical protein FPF71_15630 [Algibacter amylolyticus]|uniref:Sensor of ECF-type sigma factor n=1 Tax=Algibacter amylolyticus TaxID=1608400 RepID=A0A5M7AWX2_9FLAO|nr:hypothetical protein [Algibacter amylolyticus]KAA5821936.1 hypothetical protein F2B50_15630 [Algibacter amylolyticus]MBB5269265.1 Spy/CpxP family protein refolding chaperone [Algibacter amylolyticus]TSJ73220.1 hypothetical protein FPF71_15630 [Algibacter amylolyticus]